MKSIIKITSFVLIIVTIFSITSCNLFTRKLDIKDIKKALEEEDYYVSIEGEDPTQGIKTQLTATKGDDSLYIIIFESKKTARLYFKALNSTIDARIDILEDQIKFKEHILKEYDDYLSSDEIDDIEDEIKENKREIEKIKEDSVIKRNANTIWYGTKDALEDALS